MSTLSVIVPAFNEEAYLPRTLEALRRAEAYLGEPVEILVADNESTDNTTAVAREHGATVVPVEIRCISAVRNRAAAAAQGDYLVFVDADNRVSETMLAEIKRVLDSGKYAGGGIVHARYDRSSFGIACTHGLVQLGMRLTRLSMFMLYCTREAFEAVGGFDEQLLSSEDFAFARALRRHARQHGQAYCNLRGPELIMSARKFDEYGDYMVFRNPIKFLKACFNDPEVAQDLWYNPEKRGGNAKKREQEGAER